MKIAGTRIILILLVGMLAACQNNDIHYMALVDDQYKISKQEVSEHYKDLNYGLRYPHTEYKGFDIAREEVITKKLKQIDFINQGLHQDQELLSDIQRTVNEELLVLYFNEEYLGQYITEEVINDYYENMGKEVSYQQIVIHKNKAIPINELKQKANNIKAEAENGANFTKLVREYSEDSKSSQNDGKMPKMNWRDGTSSPQNQIIFRMPEGTVRVLETARRLLVVKVYKVKEVDLPPLDVVRPNIYKALEEIYATRAYNDFDRDKANLLDESNYDWNYEGLNQLSEWSKISRFYNSGKYKEVINDSLAAGNNFEILTYENGTVDLEKYLYLLNDILLISVSKEITADAYKEFIDEALRTEIIVQKAKDLGLDENIFSVDSDSPVIKEEMVRLYNEKFIRSRYPEQNRENYEDFHEETKDSLFYQPDKVNLRVKIFDTEEEAQDVMEKINNGNKFEDLFRAWSVKTYYINEEGKIDSYRVNEPKLLGEEAFKLSEGETSGPIKFEQDQETKYAVIKAHNVVTEKILSIDEVLPSRLDRLFRNYYWNKYNNEVVEELRRKYDVEVNESALVEMAGISK